MSDHSLEARHEAQHLVELLAVVSSCDDEPAAIRAAVERAAETLQAEIGGLLVDGTVVSAIGLPEASPDYAALAAVGVGRGIIDLPGMAECATGAALLGRPGEGVLVLVRISEPFTVAEHNLIRGMARVLGLTLRMLRTLQAQRRQEQLMRHLYEIQRLLSRRVAPAEVLRTTLAATADVVAGDHGRVQLWLLDTEVTELNSLSCTRPAGAGAPRWEVRPSADGDLASAVVRADAPMDYVTEGGHLVAAVPVHERGRTVGALAVVLPPEHCLSERDRNDLLAFAEHVSLALTDARTALDMEAARHDSLTGLASRALFHERLQQHLATAPPAGELALLFVDLDRFKAVNDTLGHAAGDLLLAEVARRLRGTVRQRDLVGRLGGDEFAVVLSPTTHDDAVDVAARIIDEVSRPYLMADGRTAEIGASVGIALNADDDEQDLIRRADVAMYRAKQSGRGRSVVLDRDAEDALPTSGTAASLPHNLTAA